MIFSTAWSLLKGHVWPCALTLAVVLAAPAQARADVLTYYPGGSASSSYNDLSDLDHHFFYAWTITGIPVVPVTEQITSASITFKNLYNWDNTANMLYLDLLDGKSAGGTVLDTKTGTTDGSNYTSTVRDAQDVAGTQNPVTTFVDEFDGSNSLTSGAKTDLTEHAFLPSASINSTDNNPGQSSDINWLATQLSNAGLPTVDAKFGTSNPQWTFAADPTGGFDYTYNFTQAQLTALTSYIDGSSSPGAITLGLDPDCHFYNDGVSLTLVENSVGAPAVPEPASLLLLGTGLLFTARKYRRRRDDAR